MPRLVDRAAVGAGIVHRHAGRGAAVRNSHRHSGLRRQPEPRRQAADLAHVSNVPSREGVVLGQIFELRQVDLAQPPVDFSGVGDRGSPLFSATLSAGPATSPAAEVGGCQAKLV
jgi:hypothetical protein